MCTPPISHLAKIESRRDAIGVSSRRFIVCSAIETISVHGLATRSNGYSRPTAIHRPSGDQSVGALSMSSSCVSSGSRLRRFSRRARLPDLPRAIRVEQHLCAVGRPHRVPVIGRVASQRRRNAAIEYQSIHTSRLPFFGSGRVNAIRSPFGREPRLIQCHYPRAPNVPVCSPVRSNQVSCVPPVPAGRMTMTRPSGGRLKEAPIPAEL